MEILRDQAQDKMTFLRNRVKYLLESKNKNSSQNDDVTDKTENKIPD